VVGLPLARGAAHSPNPPRASMGAERGRQIWHCSMKAWSGALRRRACIVPLASLDANVANIRCRCRRTRPLVNLAFAVTAASVLTAPCSTVPDSTRARLGSVLARGGWHVGRHPLRRRPAAHRRRGGTGCHPGERRGTDDCSFLNIRQNLGFNAMACDREVPPLIESPAIRSITPPLPQRIVPFRG
jgi:hypothetical protein